MKLIMTNNLLKYKWINYLNQKKCREGFTLIELLVVIIILGIFTAVALPTLVGQFGKARETESKNAIGATNRAQQAFHFENQRFGTETELDFSITTNDYLNSLNITPTTNLATVAPSNTDATADNTRAFSGAVEFNSANGAYATVVCRSINPKVQLAPPNSSLTGSEEVDDPCPNGGTGVVVK